MRLSRQGLAALGIAAMLAVAGCGGEEPPPPGLGDMDLPKPSLKPLEPTREAVEGDFDECGVVATADLAEAIGVDELYVTMREVRPQADGGRLAGCSYFVEDVPGIVGMTINTVTGTDRDGFFRAFQERKVVELDNFGDHAEAVAYSTGPLHFRELRAIQGTTGVHVRYTFNESPSGMPNIEETDQLAQLLGGTMLSMLNNLPDEIAIGDGAPEGPCAEVDLAQASEVLGDELTASRSVLGDDGAASCHFAGEGAGLEIAVITDSARAQGMRVADGAVTVADIGEGAMVQIQPNDESQGPLDARVNVADGVVLIVGEYAPDAGAVPEPRPEDTDLVRAITDAVT